MKKQILLTAAILATQTAFSLEAFRQLELYEGFEYKTQIDQEPVLNSDEKQDSAEQIQNVCSAKCTTKHTTIFISAKSKEKDIFSSINRGISIQTPTLFSAYTINTLAGNITYSGTVSRLKSPKLTFGTALKNFSALKPGLEPSLPTRNSSNKTDSACIKLIPQKQNLPQIEAAIINNGTILTNANLKLTTEKIPLLQTAITAAVFPNQKGTTAWFDKIPRFQNTPYPAAEFIITAVTNSFRTSAALSYYKLPFPTASLPQNSSLCARINTTINTGPFSITSAIFASSSAFITADGTYCHTPFQLSLNPKRIFSAKEYTFRAGLLGAVTLQTESFLSNTLCPSYRLRADATITHNNTSLTLYSVYTNSIDNPDTSAEKTLSLTGRLSVKQKTFSWTAKGTASFSGISSSSQTQVYSASANVSFAKGVFSSLASAASVTVKNGTFYKGSFSSYITLGTRNSSSNKKDKKPFNKLKFTVKTGISLTF